MKSKIYCSVWTTLNYIQNQLTETLAWYRNVKCIRHQPSKDHFSTQKRVKTSAWKNIDLPRHQSMWASDALGWENFKVISPNKTMRRRHCSVSGYCTIKSLKTMHYFENSTRISDKAESSTFIVANYFVL